MFESLELSSRYAEQGLARNVRVETPLLHSSSEGPGLRDDAGGSEQQGVEPAHETAVVCMRRAASSVPATKIAGSPCSSWRIVSRWPGAPKTTSTRGLVPGSRIECTGTPPNAAPRASGGPTSWTGSSAGHGSRSRASSSASSRAVPLGRVRLAGAVVLDHLEGPTWRAAIFARCWSNAAVNEKLPLATPTPAGARPRRSRRSPRPGGRSCRSRPAPAARAQARRAGARPTDGCSR